MNVCQGCGNPTNNINGLCNNCLNLWDEIAESFKLKEEQADMNKIEEIEALIGRKLFEDEMIFLQNRKTEQSGVNASL